MAQPLFASLEEQYRLPAGLLDSVWAAESSRGQNMLSPKGAKGHFGFMDPTAAQYGVADPNDLRQAATGAARMYRDMIDQTGGLDSALAAYNWGIGNLQRKGIENAPDETRGYIQKVRAGMAQENDPWDELNRQFAQQSAAPARQEADPWEQLNQQFAAPAAPAQEQQRAQEAAPGNTSTSRGPDGVLRVEMGGTAAPTPGPEKKGFFDGIGSPSEWARQLGLTARYGLEGLGQASQLVTEPLRQYVVNPAAGMLGLPPAAPSGSTMSSLADTLGLPAPETRQERIVGDAARLMAGGGGMMGALGAASGGAAAAGGLLPTASTTGLGQSVMAGLAANPGVQLGSAAGAGTLGGMARENGAGALGQFGASLAGGLLGGGAVMAGSSLANTARTAATRMASRPADLDIRFNRLMDEAGIDLSTIPANVARGLRAEMEAALRTGRELRPDAVRRLADFRAVGATPTRGSITLDPVQLTREQNLAKIAANSADDQLAGLPRMQNENNATLISRLNEAGAARAPEAIDAGEAAIGALTHNLDAQRSNVSALYSNARDSAGRSFPLDGASFTSRTAQALDDRLLGGALPADVRNHLNRIARGEVPFTVDYAEQLKTAMGNLQRASSDGQVRMALGVVRNELDRTPVLGLGQQTGAAGARAVNPGNLPAAAGTPQLGEEAIAAFNQARAANRAMMQNVEASPALRAVFEGTATPDQFVNRFILGKGATAADVAALRRGLGDNQQAVGAVRDHLVDYLKGKALNGAADEVGKFSSAAYNKALNAIGNRKLGQFFSPAEIAQLRAVGRVGSYMQAQPVGSAVNNSNSGALLAGRGYDFLKGVLGKIPLGESALLTPLRNIEISMRQRGAQNVLPGLLAEEMRRQGSVSAPFLLPGAAAAGGLLSAPGVYGP
ncbi:lytic transglycosylase domain-containing protein [Achromobacter aegrifaciens]|uniref:lytic transglycosylase domain-containing protein n=1 Tax=Achromobacter aegrifaciens TaxID=1287736 RepID=UPI001419FE0E|nr:lytic transglycosylase domain-containing protein [Achromobacter aegrifaciens]